MKKKLNIFDMIVNIIIILAFILAIYWFIKLLFGSTPGLSEFNALFIAMMLGILFKLYREVGEIKVGIKYEFNKIKEDINLIKKKLKV